jgi:GNAT superfamily N-acetyltransferase
MQDLWFSEEIPDMETALPLYQAVGWSNYTHDPGTLAAAFAGSTYLTTAWRGRRLAGLARVVSDEASVWYLQDLLVHPDFWRLGIATQLVERCAARFENVRGVLLTDRAGPTEFYERIGWKSAEGLGVVAHLINI